MKKVFLSLATIAFVAAGSLTLTSCGGDDSTPGPTPEPEDPALTENFIQVNNDQEAITYSLYAVHTDGAGEDAPIKEYTLNDGTIVIAFEFVSHNGGAITPIGDTNTWTTLLTKVNTASTGDDRYVFPMQTEGTTLLGGFTTTMNDTNYSFGASATFDVTELTYASQSAPGSMTYVVKGNDADDTSISLETNLKGEIQGLYSINASASKGLDRISPIKSSLTLRKSL